ncbi:MAG: hypothetical protein IPK13_20720 [Deltaproteobacteria bacterium]|nr:hypothetical protein [Deltaproteobacteria bacterium]
MRQDERFRPHLAPDAEALTLGDEERVLLEDAMRLLPQASPRDVMRLALFELVEHRRFLAWVDEHDREGKRGSPPAALPLTHTRGFGA